jgi:hypothetical protein
VVLGYIDFELGLGFRVSDILDYGSRILGVPRCFELVSLGEVFGEYSLGNDKRMGPGFAQMENILHYDAKLLVGLFAFGSVCLSTNNY